MLISNILPGYSGIQRFFAGDFSVTFTVVSILLVLSVCFISVKLLPP